MDVFSYNQKVLCNSYLAATTNDDDDGGGGDNGYPPHNSYFWSSAFHMITLAHVVGVFFSSSSKSLLFGRYSVGL